MATIYGCVIEGMLCGVGAGGDINGPAFAREEAAELLGRMGVVAELVTELLGRARYEVVQFSEVRGLELPDLWPGANMNEKKRAVSDLTRRFIMGSRVRVLRTILDVPVDAVGTVVKLRLVDTAGWIELDTRSEHEHVHAHAVGHPRERWLLAFPEDCDDEETVSASGGLA